MLAPIGRICRYACACRCIHLQIRPPTRGMPRHLRAFIHTRVYTNASRGRVEILRPSVKPPRHERELLYNARFIAYYKYAHAASREFYKLDSRALERTTIRNFDNEYRIGDSGDNSGIISDAAGFKDLVPATSALVITRRINITIIKFRDIFLPFCYFASAASHIHPVIYIPREDLVTSPSMQIHRGYNYFRTACMYSSRSSNRGSDRESLIAVN